MIDRDCLDALMAGFDSGTDRDRLLALLANIVQGQRMTGQKRIAVKYSLYAYSIAAGYSQQILPLNPSRVALIVGSNTSALNVLRINFNEGPFAPATTVPGSLASALPTLSTLLEFRNPPVNAVTLSADTATMIGVVCEGVLAQ